LAYAPTRSLTFICSFPRDAVPRDLHSFPTRRSSDLHREARDDPRAAPPAPARAAAPGRRGSHARGRVEGQAAARLLAARPVRRGDRKSTRLNSSHQIISYAVFCLKKKKKEQRQNSNT